MGWGGGGNHGQDNHVSPVASRRDFASVALPPPPPTTTTTTTTTGSSVSSFGNVLVLVSWFWLPNQRFWLPNQQFWLTNQRVVVSESAVLVTESAGFGY